MAAHRFVFDNLYLTVELVDMMPPTLELRGNELFGQYQRGELTATAEDRARTAVVQALPASPWKVRGFMFRAMERLASKGGHRPIAYKEVLGKYRSDLRLGLSYAIRCYGLKGLQDGFEEPPQPRVALDWATLREVDAYLEGRLVASLQPPPSDACLRKAVNYVFSSGAAWDPAIVPGEPTRFRANGSQKFRAVLAGRTGRSQDDVARTDVARVVHGLLARLDESAALQLDPTATVEELGHLATLRVIKAGVRNQIERALHEGGHPGLLSLIDDAGRSDSHRGQGPTDRTRQPRDELDELLDGISCELPPAVVAWLAAEEARDAVARARARLRGRSKPHR